MSGREDMLYSSFSLSLSINCKGDVGNWTAAINSYQTLDKESAGEETYQLYRLLSDISKVLHEFDRATPCTFENKPVDYYKTIPVRISNGKLLAWGVR
jgi:hypothetical protein